MILKNSPIGKIYLTDHILQRFAERVFNVKEVCSKAYISIHKEKLQNEIISRLSRSKVEANHVNEKHKIDSLYLRHNKLVFVIGKKDKVLITCFLLQTI